METKRTPFALLSALAALLVVSGGCRSMRHGADLGHRIIDRDGLPPAKFFGLIGATAGYAVGLPFTIVLLPTYPFEQLQYPSGPDHDVEMPILFSPVELSGGIGALVLGGPFRLAHRAIHGPERDAAGHEAASRPENDPGSPPQLSGGPSAFGGR